MFHAIIDNSLYEPNTKSDDYVNSVLQCFCNMVVEFSIVVLHLALPGTEPCTASNIKCRLRIHEGKVLPVVKKSEGRGGRKFDVRISVKQHLRSIDIAY